MADKPSWAVFMYQWGMVKITNENTKIPKDIIFMLVGEFFECITSVDQLTCTAKSKVGRGHLGYVVRENVQAVCGQCLIA